MSEGPAMLRTDEVLPDEDPARSYLLPAGYYIDPGIFEREKQAILFRGWHYLGHASQVAAPGDYITGRIVDQSVCVIRGSDGTLHAFYNVCQHRAHELLQGTGNVRVITCPTWTAGSTSATTRGNRPSIGPGSPATRTNTRASLSSACQ